MHRGSKADTIVTWIFLALAVAAVICYVALPANRLPFMYCGGAAIVLRLVQYLIRFIK